MYNLLKSTLREGVRAELSHNPFARGLMFLLENQEELPTKEQLVAIFGTNRFVDVDRAESSSSQADITDNRMLAMYVRGVRKFPAGKDWYMIHFERDMCPVSSIFLGSNGVGKSSLYTILEYISLGHSYLADERGYKDRDKQLEYLLHNQTPSKDAVIRLFTRQGETAITLDKIPAPLVTPAFFCSEYDIQEISRAGLSSKYICRQLGLERYHDLLETMRNMRMGAENSTNSYVSRQYDIRLSEIRLHVMNFLPMLRDNAVKTYKDFMDCTYEILKRKPSFDSILYLCEWLKLLQKVIISHNAKIGIYTVDDIAAVIKETYDWVEKHQKDWKSYWKPEVLDKELSIKYDFLKNIFTIWQEEINKILNGYEGTFVQRRLWYVNQTTDIAGKYEVYKEENRELLNDTPLLSLSDENKVWFNMALTYLETGYRRLLSEYVDVINDVLTPLFSVYFNEDVADIKASVVDSEDDGLSIQVNIRTCDPQAEKKDSEASLPSDFAENEPPIVWTDPRKFLNTFRFKMFCFLFKFSLACCMKQHHRVNFPFVVDDVFDASDFENRTDIGRLISSILSRHDNIADLFEMPLQLIFFTQDNVIADTIQRKSFYRDEVKFSQLFDYYRAEDREYIEKMNGRYLSIEDSL